MTRRELIAIGAAYLGAAILGAIGGLTSTEEGRKTSRKSGGKGQP